MLFTNSLPSQIPDSLKKLIVRHSRYFKFNKDFLTKTLKRSIHWSFSYPDRILRFMIFTVSWKNGFLNLLYNHFIMVYGLIPDTVHHKQWKHQWSNKYHDSLHSEDDFLWWWTLNMALFQKSYHKKNVVADMFNWRPGLFYQYIGIVLLV